MPASFVRAALLVALITCVLALAGCGGGDSEPEVVTVTETVTDTDSTDTGFTDTGVTDTTSTDTEGTVTDPAGEIPSEAIPTGDPEYGVGDSASWNGNEFVVSDVGTSDEEPVADLGGERDEAEGTWLHFTVTPSDEDSGVFGFEFAEEVQVRGGNGVVYRDDVHSDGYFQRELGADKFTVWVDVPEDAVSGAVFEVGDGFHEIEQDSDSAFNVTTYPDPAYMTRVDLGL
jgi:hypothetical protein